MLKLSLFSRLFCYTQRLNLARSSESDKPNSRLNRCTQGSLVTYLSLTALGLTSPLSATPKEGLTSERLKPVGLEVTSKQADLKTDFKRFLSWFEGEYNNHEQVWLQKGLEQEPIYSHVHHVFKSLLIPKLAENSFYVEQRMVESGVVFRQRLYTMSIDAKEQAIRLDIYKFKDEKAWRGLHLRPEQAKQLSRDDLIPMPGCEVYWRYDQAKNHFEGSMVKDQCRVVSSRSNTTMIINDDLILEPSAIMIRDVARNEAGDLLFGHPDQPHYRNVKVRYYKGWSVMRPGGSEHSEGESRWLLNHNLHLHNEGGRLPLLDQDEKPTGYSVMLARVTRSESKTEVLKLSVIHDETDEHVAYTWTEPSNERLGLNLRWMQVGFTVEDSSPHLGFDPAPEPRTVTLTTPPPLKDGDQKKDTEGQGETKIKEASRQVMQMKRPTLMVSNLEASLAVYRDLLGFEVFYIRGDDPDLPNAKEDDQSSPAYEYFSLDRSRYTYTRFATLNTPSQARAFGLMEVRGGVLKQATPRLSTVVLQVRDVMALKSELLKAGLKVFALHEGNTPEGMIYRELPFADPDGHVIVLYDLQEASKSTEPNQAKTK